LCMFFGGTSLVCIAAVAIEKCLAIRLHLRYHQVITTHRTIKLAIAYWMFYSCFIVIYSFLVNTHNFQILANVMFLSCIVGVAVCYLAIFRNVRRHRRQIKQLETAFNSHAIKHGRSLRNMFFIHGFFALSLLPNIVYFALALLTKNRHEAFWMLASTCSFLICAVNPFVYVWRLTEMRAVIFKMLGCQRKH